MEKREEIGKIYKEKLHKMIDSINDFNMLEYIYWYIKLKYKM